MRGLGFVAVVLGWALVSGWDLPAAERTSLFDYLDGTPPGRLVGFTPSELDPRNPANQTRLATSSLQADLKALRPAFDGLVLYGYHEASTPRTVAVAKELGYRAVLLAVWDIKSTVELDGVAALAEQYENDLTLGIIVGNEGLTFGRYEEADLAIAEQRLRFRLGRRFPLTAGWHCQFTSFGVALALPVFSSFCERFRSCKRSIIQDHLHGKLCRTHIITGGASGTLRSPIQPRPSTRRFALKPHRHWQSQWHPKQNLYQCHPAGRSDASTGFRTVRPLPCMPLLCDSLRSGPDTPPFSQLVSCV